MKLRDKILSADDLSIEIVEVPEWDVKLEVRSPSAKLRARMVSQAMTSDDEGESSMNLELIYPTLLVACCFDPDTGEQVFTDEDAEAINAKSSAAVEKVAQACLRVSGLSNDTEKVLGKG